MIKHERDKLNKENPRTFQLLQMTRKTWINDGLNSLLFKVAEFIERYLSNIRFDQLNQNFKTKEYATHVN